MTLFDIPESNKVLCDTWRTFSELYPALQFSRTNHKLAVDD